MCVHETKEHCGEASNGQNGPTLDRTQNRRQGDHQNGDHLSNHCSKVFVTDASQCHPVSHLQNAIGLGWSGVLTKDLLKKF